MDIFKVVSALNSALRIQILRILAKEPKTVIEVLEELKKKNIEVKYRETVYRALEKLFDAELVEKYYEKGKGICYKLIANRIVINLTEGTIEK
jgi:Fe2+ or Zn2+ uptake regulation protein